MQERLWFCSPVLAATRFAQSNNGNVIDSECATSGSLPLFLRASLLVPLHTTSALRRDATKQPRSIQLCRDNGTVTVSATLLAFPLSKGLVNPWRRAAWLRSFRADRSAAPTTVAASTTISSEFIAPMNRATISHEGPQKFLDNAHQTALLAVVQDMHTSLHKHFDAAAFT